MNRYKYKRRYIVEKDHFGYLLEEYGLFLYFPQYKMTDCNRKYNKIFCNIEFEYIKFKDSIINRHLKRLVKNI